jgi:anthranilate synthase component II
MDSTFTAARYHSLVIEKETFPHDALEVTAWTEDGLIMAARQRKYKHILFFFRCRVGHYLLSNAGL